MFINSINIKNYRLFSKEGFIVDRINIPDGEKEGSGLTVFVGENGCGKTSILDAIALSLLEYRGESFSVDDLNDPKEYCLIEALAKEPFEVKSSMPKGSFFSKGFLFKAGLRDRKASSFLSSMIVSDLYYNSVDPEKPKIGSPDSRVSVNNPFSGKRFSENDFLVLDKNRLYQIKAGTFSSTRFDRLMEDLDYQYVKSKDVVPNLNNALFEIIKQAKPSNEYLKKSIIKFRELTEIESNLDFIDNYHPYRTASFVCRKENNQQIKISSLGSGYEMIFTLIYSYFLSLQSGKQLIVIIDEPELHMHPKLQQRLLKFILSISKDAQVFISTHSPLLIKQLSGCSSVEINVINKNYTISSMQERMLPYVSSNETNYLAFDLPTEEYHNELYEYLLLSYGNENNSIKEFDNRFFVKEHKESKEYPWKGNPNEVSFHTFVRNQIHHRIENGIATEDNLRQSIERMREYCSELKGNDSSYPE